MQTIKVLDTKDNTYCMGIAFSKTAKTSYEQRIERRERLIKLIIQRIAALILISLCTIISYYTKEGMCFVVGLLIGVAMFFSNLD